MLLSKFHRNYLFTYKNRKADIAFYFTIYTHKIILFSYYNAFKMVFKTKLKYI